MECRYRRNQYQQFNAYDDLFSIRKQPDESLQALMNRIDESMRTISNLRPKDFNLAKLDEELVCMAMIRSLPEEYSHFSSSLLLLDSLDKTKLQNVFVTEELNRSRRPDVLSTSSSVDALKTSSPTSSQKSASFRRGKGPQKCDYCGRDNHISRRCYKRMDDLIQSSESPANANTASNSTTTSAQFAGNASLRSDPLSLSPATLMSSHADLLWCADTGAVGNGFFGICTPNAPIG